MPLPKISIHALLAESDHPVICTVNLLQHFYPRSPCGERRNPARRPTGRRRRFLSTLSLRRATAIGRRDRAGRDISIHALLAESDLDGLKRKLNQHRFLSTLSLRRATTNQTNTKNLPRRFLSTLSLRRATKAIKIRINLIDNFYPRSPCGERLLWVLQAVAERDQVAISIHALLTESDTIFAVRPYDAPIFLSTLSLRRAT